VIFAAVPVEPTPRLRSRLALLSDPFVVAADRGAATAFAFGYTPDVVVGDLDSIDASTLADLKTRGVPIETHSRDKDATDGQLAVERALRELDEPSGLWLIGFLGGPRLDQALANVLLLLRLRGSPAHATLLDERNELVLVRPGRQHTWRAEPGEVISLMPLGEDADGVRTVGLRWPLDGDRLIPGDTRGVSNEAVSDAVGVSVERGLLLVTRHFAD
jgi:thiamine pyrophosphokinase